MTVVFACLDALKVKACFYFEASKLSWNSLCVPGLLPRAEIIVMNHHALLGNRT